MTVAATRRPKDALPILVAGVLVDIDHLVDFAYYHLRGPGRFIAPLHGWEYVLALLSADRGNSHPERSAGTTPRRGRRMLRSAQHDSDGGPPSAVNRPGFRLLLAAGLASHLALDQIHAPSNPLAYWVLYRLSRAFNWHAMQFIEKANEEWKDTPWWRWL